MKRMYIECAMGAAGDMLMAALYELIDEKEKFISKMNSLGLPGVHVRAVPAVKCGITGTHMEVTVDGKEEHEHHHGHHHSHHEHSTLHGIEHIVSHMDLSEKIKKDILNIYTLIAEAEAAAHGTEIDQIHFHEVGTLDAVADISGICILMDMIKADEVTVSPVHVGSGHVHCAHGILPVPAPATAHILKGVPVYGGSIDGELCTPTGAAVLKYFADSFGPMPVMAAEKTGYGMGTKDFESANCVRIFTGEEKSSADRIAELTCNIDDMTPEEISYAADKLMEKGALDVFVENILMKKGRPAFMLTVLCRTGEEDEFAEYIFRQTSTIGIRKKECERYILERHVETEDGMRVKVSSGYGTEKRKIEFEDRKKAADEKNVGITEVR